MNDNNSKQEAQSTCLLFSTATNINFIAQLPSLENDCQLNQEYNWKKLPSIFL